MLGTIVLAVAISVAASLLPIDILGNLVSLGTATAFGIVCISVLWLRKERPDLERPFRAPGGMWTPILGVVGAVMMAGPLIVDMVLSVMKGDPMPAFILLGYAGLGVAIYAIYGLPNSRLAAGLGQRRPGDNTV